MNRAEFTAGLEYYGKKPYSDKERIKLIKDIILNSNPVIKQVVAMEECAELSQQISKHIRGEKDELALIEEMADVYICLHYLMVICGIEYRKLMAAFDTKLTREHDRTMQ